MNPEQIKILSVIIATLIFALIMQPRSGSSHANTAYASNSGGGSKPSKKANTGNSKPSCRKKGYNLYGKVQFVESFPDLTIQYVSSFPDINVQFVSSFPSSCGQWQEVDSFPDFKVKVVSSFPDLKVKKVSSFPGMN